MKKLFFMFVLFLPFVVGATSSYEITNFVKTNKGYNYSYSNYEYTDFIGEKNGSLYLNGNSSLYILDKDTLEEKSSVVQQTFYDLKVADDKFYNVYSSGSSSAYSLTLRFYTDTFGVGDSVSIAYGDTTKRPLVRDYVYSNGYFYILYNFSYSDNYYLLIVDKDGKVNYNQQFTTSISRYIRVFDKNVYLIENNSSGDRYVSINTVSSDGTISLKAKIDDMSFDSLNYCDSEFILVGTKYDGTTSVGVNVVVLNSKFEMVKNKSLSDFVSFVYYIADSIIKYNDEYIFLNTNDKNLYFLDSDFKLLYKVDCNKSLTYSTSYYGPYMSGSTIYVVGGYGIQGYTEDAGNFVIQLDTPIVTPEVHNFNIESKVLSGEGNIEVINISQAGEEISFVVTPADGYTVASIVLKDKDGKVIEYKDNKFTMPSGDVVLEVEFEKVEENPNTIDNIVVVISFLILGAYIIYFSVRKYNINN